MLNRLSRAEEGIAIITVLLVIAVVGVFGVLTLSAAREDLRFSTSDTAAEQALDRAEAGLDSAVEYLTLHSVTPSQTCVLPSTVNCFKLINPTTGTPDIEVAFAGTDTAKGEWVEFRVRSTASVRGTRRTLQQMNRVNLLSLPYGLFVRGNLDFRGTFELKNESILVEGNVTGRDRVKFDKFPPGLGVEDQDYGWIYHSQYINTRPGPPPCALLCPVPEIQLCPSSGTPGFYYAHLDLTLPVSCAGVFASGTISLVGGGAAAESKEIHTGPETDSWKNPLLATCLPGDPFCSQDRDTHQRVLGVSGTGPPVVDVPDPLVIVRHLEELRRTAQNQGLYFNTTSDGPNPDTFTPGKLNSTNSPQHRHFSRDLVFFFETRSNQTIKIDANLAPDSTSAAVWERGDCIGPDTGTGSVSDFRQPSSDEATEVSSQSGLIIVRGGATLSFRDICWSGAIFNQSGSVLIEGQPVFIGTVWAENFDVRGNALIKLDPSWFGRIPAGFRDVERKDWVECESFVSGSC